MGGREAGGRAFNWSLQASLTRTRGGREQARRQDKFGKIVKSSAYDGGL